MVARRMRLLIVWGLKVGEASSKMVWQPGSRFGDVTATALNRGSLPAATVQKNEPKLLPESPIFALSISMLAAGVVTLGCVGILRLRKTRAPGFVPDTGVEPTAQAPYQAEDA